MTARTLFYKLQRFNPQRIFDEPLISLSNDQSLLIFTMRASHIALLSLAASTAAPVFAAPLSYVVIFMAAMTPLTCRFSTVMFALKMEEELP
jgi:hypothetical protein